MAGRRKRTHHDEDEDEDTHGEDEDGGSLARPRKRTTSTDALSRSLARLAVSHSSHVDASIAAFNSLRISRLAAANLDSKGSNLDLNSTNSNLDSTNPSSNSNSKEANAPQPSRESRSPRRSNDPQLRLALIAEVDEPPDLQSDLEDNDVDADAPHKTHALATHSRIKHRTEAASSRISHFAFLKRINMAAHLATGGMRLNPEHAKLVLYSPSNINPWPTSTGSNNDAVDPPDSLSTTKTSQNHINVLSAGASTTISSNHPHSPLAMDTCTDTPTSTPTSLPPHQHIPTGETLAPPSSPVSSSSPHTPVSSPHTPTAHDLANALASILMDSPS